VLPSSSGEKTEAGNSSKAMASSYCTREQIRVDNLLNHFLRLLIRLSTMQLWIEIRNTSYIYNEWKFTTTRNPKLKRNTSRIWEMYMPCQQTSPLSLLNIKTTLSDKRLKPRNQKKYAYVIHTTWKMRFLSRSNRE
jgi:hypothetical protein